MGKRAGQVSRGVVARVRLVGSLVGSPSPMTTSDRVQAWSVRCVVGFGDRGGDPPARGDGVAVGSGPFTDRLGAFGAR